MRKVINVFLCIVTMWVICGGIANADIATDISQRIKLSTQSTAIQANDSDSKYSTSAIQAICDQYGYSSGRYWSYNTTTGSSTAYTASTHKAVTVSSGNSGEEGWAGYKFPTWGGWTSSECWGFTEFIGYQLSGTVPHYGWTSYSSYQAAGGLKVGDILRASGHSAIIYSINFSTGEFFTAECWGGNNNIIYVGNHWELHHVTGKTIELVMKNYNLEFILRAPDNSNPLYVPASIT